MAAMVQETENRLQPEDRFRFHPYAKFVGELLSSPTGLVTSPRTCTCRPCPSPPWSHLRYFFDASEFSRHASQK
jgi:hypothetical protein